MADANSRVRGTPLEVAGHPARLFLVLSTLFFSFPALLYKPMSQLDGASTLPEWLVYYSLLGGAAAWAWASFMSSSEWLSFGLATFIGTGLHLVSTHTVAELPVAVVGGAAAALVGAGLLSSPFLRPLDALLTLGVLGLAGQHYHAAKGEASLELQCVLAVAGLSLLSAPGLIGHKLAGLSASLLIVPAVPIGLLGALLNRTAPTLVVGLLSFLLAFVRLIGLPPEPTPAAKQTARASRYLLAGLLASLSIISGAGVPESGRRAGLAVVTLILAGASCALIVTSLLARTAHTWGPVRSGEYQMVTLDFLALLLYFVMPLAVLLYLAWLQLPALPAALSDSIAVPQLDFLRPGTFFLALALAVLLVFTQESFEESSILWAHWLISTFTYGVLDAKNVALVARLEPLLKHVSAPGDLPSVLKSSGLCPLNLFVSADVARAHPEVVRALADAGHVLGTETRAGPFTPFFRAFSDVQGVFDLVKGAAGGKAPEWYLGTGGHRNPWALVRAASLHQSLIAPALVVELSRETGPELRAILDDWFKGGLVFLDAGKSSVRAGGFCSGDQGSMPRYFCDYCQTYLTHDSAPGRKQHNRGWKHRENVKTYYEAFMPGYVPPVPGAPPGPMPGPPFGGPPPHGMGPGGPGGPPGMGGFGPRPPMMPPGYGGPPGGGYPPRPGLYPPGPGGPPGYGAGGPGGPRGFPPRPPMMGQGGPPHGGYHGRRD